MKKFFGLLLMVYGLTGCKSAAPLPQKAQAAGSRPVAIAPDTANVPKEIVNLPVFIPAAELQNRLYQLFFAPNYGKYYPCNGNSDCGNAYKDLYVEEPYIHIYDSLITIKMHLAGTAHVLFSFNVDGDIMLSATPLVRNDTLFFQNVTLVPASESILLSITTSLFGQKIVNNIQQHAWYSFRPQLDSMTAVLKKNFPLKWGNIYLLLNLNKIYLNKVQVQQQPVEGIIANFAAELTEEKSNFINLPLSK